MPLIIMRPGTSSMKTSPLKASAISNMTASLFTELYRTCSRCNRRPPTAACLSTVID